MGQPKLLLPWGKTSVLGHLLRQWTRLRAAQIAVVCAADANPLNAELDRLGFPDSNRIFNPAPDQGMFSSIRCAAAWPGWKSDLTHWTITLGDQPQIADATLKQLLAFAAEHPEKICQPLRNERRKHPVVLPTRFFEELKTTPVNDLKSFLSLHVEHLSGFQSEDTRLDFDMDTPEDYERLKREFLTTQ